MLTVIIYCVITLAVYQSSDFFMRSDLNKRAASIAWPIYGAVYLVDWLVQEVAKRTKKDDPPQCPTLTT